MKRINEPGWPLAAILIGLMLSIVALLYLLALRGTF